MKIQNNKQRYVTMLSVLIASMLMLSTTGTYNALADTGIDTTDYYGQALKIFGQKQKLETEVKGFEQQITDLKVASNASPMNNAVINSKISDLQTQVDADKKQIDDASKEMKRLEILNIKSYQVDPQTAQNLYAAEDAIRAKYMKDDTHSNPIQLVAADLKHRNILVILDPDQVKNGNATLGGHVVTLDAKSFQMSEPTQDIPVDIQYGKTQLASCTNVNLQCTPIEAGVSISNIAVHTLNTLGYEATRGTATGFVIAGHTATESNTIVQPYTSNNVIGTVTIHGTGGCDCAFVAINQAAVNKIFGQEQYPIQNKIPTSQQTVGSWVYKQGAATGLSFGQITYNNPSYPFDIHAQMNVGVGDSGSPVFAYNSQSGINLYGMVYGMSSGGGVTIARYTPWDYIQSNIGAIPAP